MKEIEYTIKPSTVDMEILYDYLINNLSFNKVLELYLLLKNKLQQPSVKATNKTYKIESQV